MIDLTNAYCNKISTKCPRCNEFLFRITADGKFDRVYCLTHTLGGDCKCVVTQGAVLEPYALSNWDIDAIINKFGLLRRDDLLTG